MLLNRKGIPVRKSSSPVCGILEFSMRALEIIENELIEISATFDDSLKFERIVAWCAAHPDEVPFALHLLLGRGNVQEEKGS